MSNSNQIYHEYLFVVFVQSLMASASRVLFVHTIVKNVKKIEISPQFIDTKVPNRERVLDSGKRATRVEIGAPLKNVQHHGKTASSRPL